MIYGLSVTFLFTASAVYHARKRGENEQTLWRKMDHFAIFVMIAGTYTPFSIRYLDGTVLITVLAIQWGLVLAGAFFKFCYINGPRIMSTLVYLAMGWMVVLVTKYFIHTMPMSQIVLIVAGGVAYSVGAIMYALKKPVLVRGFFGFHELFHLFIMLGAGLHYAGVLRAL